MFGNEIKSDLRQSNPDQPMNRPAFFIVGAPRCGTTALSDFLGQHPEIYFSYIKEPHYFGSDLAIHRGFNTEAEYLELFRDAQNQLCGEGSTWYLFSKRAAQEIHDYNPHSKIIIMLRNPAQLLYSWHGFMLMSGEETIEDFQEALAAEQDRRQGKRIPKGTPVHKLLYTDIPRYVEQLQRFYDVFPQENIHIVIYDDFINDQQQVMSRIFSFLGVDAKFKPKFAIINAHSKVRNKAIRNFVEHPPEFVRRLVKVLTPRHLRSRIRHTIRQRNTIPSTRAPLDPEVRNRLDREFASEIRKLSALLNRDFSSWIRGAG